jgi:predicted permease
MGRGEVIIREFSDAARGLRRSPGFTVAVVATLALGIGANAGLFDVVDRLFLQPPAFVSDAEAVHRVYFTQRSRDRVVTGGAFGYSVYRDLRRASVAMTTVAGHFASELVVGTGDQRRPEPVRLVSGNYWELFDAHPALGRFFTDDEDQLPDGEAVAVLSHAYWVSAHGSDPGVLGTSLRVGSRAYTIVGVAPPGFHGMAREPAIAFLPLTAAAADIVGAGFEERPFNTWIELVGRRSAGVAEATAEEELTRLLRGIWEESSSADYVERTRPSIVLAPSQLDRGPMRRASATTSLWLLGTSGFVVLIACLNIANLLLARALHRGRELAIRAALGGQPARFAMGALAESVLLSGLGGLLGVPLALWVARGAGSVLFPGSAVSSTGLDPRLIAFVALLVPVTAILTSAVPWVRARRVDLAALLSSGARGATGAGGRARAALMVTQAALCAVLLVGTGLFSRSLVNAVKLDLGYEAERIQIVRPDVRGSDLSPEEIEHLSIALLDRAGTIPSVSAAALSLTVPWLSNSFDGVRLEDGTAPSGSFATHAVSGGYFDVMGTRVVRGRGIEGTDGADTPPVVVVSESMARALWGDDEALGQCLRLRESGECRRVVGVAQDIRRGDIRDGAGMQYYVPSSQYGVVPRILLLRLEAPRSSPGRGDEAIRAIQRELASVAPASAFIRIEPLQRRVAMQTVTWRAGAVIFGALGFVAVSLAALGLFSVLWFDVARHTREHGVRLALGSTGPGLVRRVVRRGVGLVLLGAMLGLGAAYSLAASFESLLFQVPARDPVTFLGVALVLLVTAVTAAALPGLKAARVDPLVLLRAE